MHKTCSECGQSKLMIDFYSKSRKSNYQESAAGVSHRCKECDKIARKAYVSVNTDKCAQSDRKYHLSKYGLTPEDYNMMFERQKGKCLGCEKHQSEFSRRLVVDHDHKTGKIRGLLCTPCNLILGYAKDQTVVLESLIKYLTINSELAEQSNVDSSNTAKKVGYLYS